MLAAVCKTSRDVDKCQEVVNTASVLLSKEVIRHDKNLTCFKFLSLGRCHIILSLGRRHKMANQ